MAVWAGLVTEMTANSVADGEYLRPQVEAFFPNVAAEFRALYQCRDNWAPEHRFEGLASMTDEEIERLALALQAAAMSDTAGKIQELWAAVCEQGRRVS